MDKDQPVGAGISRDLGRLFRIEMRPIGVLLPRGKSALGYQEIGALSQPVSIRARSGIRDITDYFTLKIEAEADTARNMAQDQPFFQERQLHLRQFNDLRFRLKVFDGQCERLFDQLCKKLFPALLDVNIKSLFKLELGQDMQAENMVEMEMADKEMDRLLVALNMPVKLIKTIARVKDDIFPRRLDQDADRAAGFRVVPAVGAEKSDLDVFHTPIIAQHGIILKR